MNVNYRMKVRPFRLFYFILLYIVAFHLYGWGGVLLTLASGIDVEVG